MANKEYILAKDLPNDEATRMAMNTFNLLQKPDGCPALTAPLNYLTASHLKILATETRQSSNLATIHGFFAIACQGGNEVCKSCTLGKKGNLFARFQTTTVPQELLSR